MKKSILQVIHESAKGLFDIGLMDAKTMRSFDAMRAIDVGLDSLKKGTKFPQKTVMID